MGRIADFQCTYENVSGFGTWLEEESEITFPQAYTESEMMKKLALAVKKHSQSRFCKLPFCHTLEAEALGGEIRLGDGVHGPRVCGYRYHELEEILELPGLDVSSRQASRIRETFAACKQLTGDGEEVLFLVSGPVTILNSLVDAEILFCAMLKQPELVQKVFWKLGRDILNIMKMAEHAGVRYLSYADPSAGVGIVGPKVAARFVKDFTADFFRTVDEELGRDIMVLFCPKTALALIGTESAVWKDWKLPEPMGYLEAAAYMREHLGIRFAGQDCINHTGHQWKDGVFRELVLKGPEYAEEK